MKSAQINEYGGSEIININQSASEPTVSSGKVLVTVKAAGVNPADWKIREGGLQQLVSLQFPSTLGMDFSGVIKQVGESISSSEFKQGDEVYGQAGVINGGSGTFAETALAKVENIAHKPKRLSHDESAALPLVGVAAWWALKEDIGLSKGIAKLYKDTNYRSFLITKDTYQYCRLFFSNTYNITTSLCLFWTMILCIWNIVLGCFFLIWHFSPSQYLFCLNLLS
jgi:NADPH:quinone reductase-like Zn-dependent oxidoreductase